MDARKGRRQQSVAAHRHPDTRLSELEHEQHRCHRNHRADRDKTSYPRQVRAFGTENVGQRVANIEKPETRHAG